jgi:hypothetical protein
MMPALPPKQTLTPCKPMSVVPIADIPPFIRSVALLISTYRHPAAMAA